MSKRYWIAHARGCDFTRLRTKGFLTLYPTIDDYVFLEVTDKNRLLLTKQTELGVSFLKQKTGLVTVPEADIMAMQGKTTGKITEGAEVLAVTGAGAGLEGEVKEIRGHQATCILRGLTRVFELVVDLQDLVLAPSKPLPSPA